MPAAKPDTRRRRDAETCRISVGDYRRLTGFIHEFLGITLPDKKRAMVEARLRRRLRHLGMASFRDYVAYALDDEGSGEELPHLIDAITTNKTDFFREPHHFEYLKGTVVPTLAASIGAGVRRPFSVWSAACSSGEEPYTLAMVLSDVAASRPDFDFRICASDISPGILRQAVRGVYDAARVDPVPMAMRKRYLLRGTGAQSERVKVAAEVQRRITFRQQNLKDPFVLHRALDVVFCRNVLIYFDWPTRRDIIARICERLSPGGYLMLGHSETIHGLDLPLDSVAPTTYRLR
ncbi:MAG: chemotaxis protein CheR [Planctomycetes bacterium]|nr:chemotaxis protein CheR [Planctomycetota bacterium]